MCSKGKEDRWFVTNCPLHSSHTLRLYLALLQMALDFNIFLTVDEAWIMWSAFHTSLHFHTMKNKQSRNSEHWHLFLIHSDWITRTVGRSHSGEITAINAADLTTVFVSYAPVRMYLECIHEGLAFLHAGWMRMTFQLNFLLWCCSNLVLT